MTHLVITLARTTREDLSTLFHFQRDPQAAYLAAFTSPDSEDQATYLKKYSPFLTDPTFAQARQAEIAEYIYQLLR